MREAGLTFENAGPWITAGIDRAVQHEWQLLIELAMLVWHLAANHPTAEGVHSLGNTHVFLHLPLAGMPR